MGQTNQRSTLVIGTRGSRLALWQAGWVQAQLERLTPHVSIRQERIKTSGDAFADVSLATIGGKGLFVKEIEEALLRGDIDLAVHSMKDMPTHLPDGLAILAVPEREDPRDVLVSRDSRTLRELTPGSRVGTSSLRRQAQLLHARSDLKIDLLRGNLDTRLRKVREGQYEAIVLAAAGLQRLGWTSAVTEFLPPEVSLPAVGQAALGLEGRDQDTFVKGLIQPLNHPPSYMAVEAERAVLKRLEGGCQAPIAAYARFDGSVVSIEGMVASPDGSRLVRDRIQGPGTQAHALGVRLAERLLQQGAAQILETIYGTG